MYIHTRKLYSRKKLLLPHRVQIVLIFIAIALPFHVFSDSEAYTQQFRITAYYSPEPGQCCYVRGGLKADRTLNGNGSFGADGTSVYPGMIAAPPSYSFGTVIVLPGIGTFTVHDRGGAIQELGSGIHRLDIWVGSGEEGLARALEFGMQDIKGKVYSPGTNQPRETFSLESLPSSHKKLSVFSIHAGDILSLEPKEGDRSMSVRILQDYLKQLGYFSHTVTGFFGPTTRKSFQAFLADFGLEKSAKLTEQSAAFLKAALRRQNATEPITGEVDRHSSRARIMQAQRLLRYLGYYSGRSDGVWSDQLAHSILTFQKERGIVAAHTDMGAGRIGPATRAALLKKWNRTVVSRHAEDLLSLHALQERQPQIGQFIGEGNTGPTVLLLQQTLADMEFFPEQKINGNFGQLTKEAVTQYQLSRGVIQSRSDTGAGYVGPATLSSLRYEERQELYRLAKEKGWDAL